MTDDSARNPLGRPESEQLEFKGRDSLDHPERVAREVVAMLNSGGGEIWVGIAEEGGVARRIEPLDAPGQQKDRLLDCFVERIEPSPSDDEVRLSVEEVGLDRVLLVRVRSGIGRRPYALLGRGARAFLRRVGRRIIPMSREDLAAAFGGRDQLSEATNLQRRKSEAVTAGKSVIWMGLVFDRPLDLSFASDESLRADAKMLLSDPSLSGNRVSGWTVMNWHTQGGHSADRVWQAPPGSARNHEWGKWRLTLYADGTLDYTGPLQILEHSEARVLYPYALLEYPTSFMRLAARLLHGRDAGSRRATFDLLIQGIEGWRLWPYSPHAAGYGEEFFARPPCDEDILTLPKPLEFGGADLTERPDACAWDAIRRIYLEFGYSEEHIPREFDQERKRLRIGE